MFKLSEMTMQLEYFGNVSIYFGIGVQIIFAILLGGLVGFDRELKMKAAGLKTNIMICIGATIYTTISLFHISGAETMVDPNRVAAQIVSGIGFLGAGAIIQGRGSVTGMTTAATIWVVAAIGFTIGIGYPFVATLFSITVLTILRLINPLNRFIERGKDYSDYHIEMLSRGSFQKEISQILYSETLTISEMYEENYNEDKDERILNVLINAHSRAVDRIVNEIQDSIKIKKVNYREFDKNYSESTQIKNLALHKKQNVSKAG